MTLDLKGVLERMRVRMARRTAEETLAWVYNTYFADDNERLTYTGEGHFDMALDAGPEPVGQGYA